MSPHAFATISSPGRTPLLPPVIQIHSLLYGVCAKSRTSHTLPAGKLQPLPVPNRPWSHIAVDFVTDLPKSQGMTVILIVIDRFSRGVRFVPFPQLPTTFQTAECLFNHVFRFFGIPEDIASDRGVQFTSRVWKAFMHKLGISVSLTSGYHPQSNGQCERANQELAKFLRVYCYDNWSDWAMYLPWAEIAQNSLTSSTTSLTPFQCILGFQSPLMPWSPQSSDVPAVDHWMRRSEEVWEQTHQRIESVAQRQKEQADKHPGGGAVMPVGLPASAPPNSSSRGAPSDDVKPTLSYPSYPTRSDSPVF
ncbi:hypothetical protein NFI96_024897 [Prochilodus magdalenae]|nr:hypothetical protein NFI96_024897 [Prochilodus magdalenae]